MSGMIAARLDEKRIVTFIDTPGHAAFSDMRSRGAQVTDIALLVVAVDDGVQEQTLEALQQIRAAKVPLVVALTKADKAGDQDRAKNQLMAHGVLLEEFGLCSVLHVRLPTHLCCVGGEVPCVPVSSVTKQGMDELLDAILLLAEMQGLMVPAKGPATAAIIETQMQRGLGSVASVVVQKGNLMPLSACVFLRLAALQASCVWAIALWRARHTAR